jgi:site-specific recombinase XerD
MQHVKERVDLPGSARMVLVDNVVPFAPEPQIFEAMLEGWARQQRVRFLKKETIDRRLALVRRASRFSGQYPWQWSAAEIEAFIDDLCSGSRPIRVSTARGHLTNLQLFLGFVTDPRYGWAAACTERFGQAPQQVLGEWNTIPHANEYEGAPERRPFTYDEVQTLFDAADGLVESIRARRRKGALAAQRDAALLKMFYAFGLRRREAWGLDLADLRRNPKMPALGRAGVAQVRWGKSSRGGPPKRRTVLLVPEMDWIVPVLDQWVEEVRPLFSPGAHPAWWVTERRGRMSRRRMDDVFASVREAAGLDEALDLHCLRHSYITHLIEFGYPERFVQDQVGHRYASTTAIYTGVSLEFRNRLLTQSLRDRRPELWEPAL